MGTVTIEFIGLDFVVQLILAYLFVLVVAGGIATVGRVVLQRKRDRRAVALRVQRLSGRN